MEGGGNSPQPSGLYHGTQKDVKGGNMIILDVIGIALDLILLALLIRQMKG